MEGVNKSAQFGFQPKTYENTQASFSQITQPAEQNFLPIERGAQILQPTPQNFNQFSYQPTQHVGSLEQNRYAVFQIPDYLVWSIFNCLCCCWCLGLFAIHYSSLTRTAKMTMNAQQAQENSKTAFSLNIASTLLGIIIIAVVIGFNWNEIEYVFG